MVPVNHFELGPSTVIKTELKFAYIKKEEKKKLVLQHVLQWWPVGDNSGSISSVVLRPLWSCAGGMTWADGLVSVKCC